MSLFCFSEKLSKYYSNFLPTQIAFCFFLGCISVLSFSPFNFKILIIFSLSIFFHSIWKSQNIKEAGLKGYFFGLGFMSIGVSWIYISIEKFGGVSPFLAIIFTILFIFFISAYFFIFGALTKYLSQESSKIKVMVFIVPSVWFLIEIMRATFFTGFPWLSIGYSQIDGPFSNFAPVVGIYGVGFILALISALLTLWKKIWPILAIFSIWSAGYGFSLINWTEPIDDEMKVTIIQGNIAQSEKWKPQLFSKNLQLYLNLTRQHLDSDIIVWPETAIAAFSDQIEKNILKPIQKMASKESFDLLTGIVTREKNGNYYNSVINLGVSGRQVYSKKHLVPFGEYLPLKFFSKKIFSFLDIPMSDFSSGDNRNNIFLNNYPVGINICYEDTFPAVVKESLPNATYLINVSNDAWFGNSLAPHQHLEIARMRALEFGRFFIRSTNNGISAIIDNKGKIVKISPQFQKSVLSYNIKLYKGSTPFNDFHNNPLLVITSITLLMALLKIGIFAVKN